MNNAAVNPPTRRYGPRVGIVQRLDLPGGVQSVALSIIKGLNAHNIIPDILWDVPPKPEMLEEKGLLAHFQPVKFPIPTRTLDRVPVTARHILRTVNLLSSRQLSQSYDFFFIFYNGFLVNDGTPHLRYLSGPPLLPQLETASPGLRGLPIRSFRWAYHRWLHHYLPVYDFHRNSHYVINSQFTAQLFEEAHGIRLQVVHPPIDLSGRGFHPDDLSRRDTITFFSRFVDYKRPEMVLALAERYPDIRFVLMGGVKSTNRDYFDGLQAQAKRANLQNAEFIANPSDEQVREELARTRIYVFPTINEHFGMATAEAIGSGALPFVHDSGGQREIVPDPRLRFTDEVFFERFSELLRLPETELNAIRIALHENVQRFSEDAFIEKILSMMNKRLERGMQNEFQATTV